MFAILDYNPQLRPYAGEVERRVRRWRQVKAALLSGGGTLSQFANGALYFGIHSHKKGWVYREWAPAAQQLWLMGDFNGWDRTAHPMARMGNGIWELLLPGDDALLSG